MKIALCDDQKFISDELSKLIEKFDNENGLHKGVKPLEIKIFLQFNTIALGLGKWYYYNVSWCKYT